MKRRKGISLACVLLALAGCAENDPWKAKRPKTAPAAGVVTYNGKPLDGATITIIPTSGAHGASALSDANGEFQLQTFPPDDGVVPGSYNVIVTKSFIPPNPDPGSEESRTPQYAKLLVPQKYTTPDTSGLTVEIPAAGKKDIQFQLDDK